MHTFIRTFVKYCIVMAYTSKNEIIPKTFRNNECDYILTD